MAIIECQAPEDKVRVTGPDGEYKDLTKDDFVSEGFGDLTGSEQGREDLNLDKGIVGGTYTETSRVTETVTINDPNSDASVDVERITSITFTSSGGGELTLEFTGW